MTERSASLFHNDRNQTVRIPREFEMEGTEVLMRKEGDRLILTPIRKNRLTRACPTLKTARRRHATRCEGRARLDAGHEYPVRPDPQPARSAGAATA